MRGLSLQARVRMLKWAMTHNKIDFIKVLLSQSRCCRVGCMLTWCSAAVLGDHEGERPQRHALGAGQQLHCCSAASHTPYVSPCMYVRQCLCHDRGRARSKSQKRIRRSLGDMAQSQSGLEQRFQISQPPMLYSSVFPVHIETLDAVSGHSACTCLLSRFISCLS